MADLVLIQQIADDVLGPIISDCETSSRAGTLSRIPPEQRYGNRQDQESNGRRLKDRVGKVPASDRHRRYFP